MVRNEDKLIGIKEKNKNHDKKKYISINSILDKINYV
jgi:hypothetical protein